MEYGIVQGALHLLVGLLLYPVIFALIISLIVTLWELGKAIAEPTFALTKFNIASLQAEQLFKHYATKRLERVDLLARSGPILGLMGTLIPLGPGLTALGSGNIELLATALTVAFDTTVIGLLVGLVAFIIGRVRRRWYENTWQNMQLVQQQETAVIDITQHQEPSKVASH